MVALSFLSPLDPPDPPDLPNLGFDGFVLSFVRALLGAGASSPLVSDDTYTISLLVQPAVCCYLPRSTLWCKPWHPYPRPSPPDLPVLQRILCICICGSFPAPSNAIRFYFSPSSFSPQVSQICGSLVVGFGIRSDILLGWYYEALVTVIDLVYVLVNVQSFFHLLCCLRSSQSFKMFAALFLCGLGSFVTILKVSNGNSLALEQSLTVVYNFLLVCAVTVDASLLFSPHSWQLGKKCDSSCFLTLNRSSLGCDSLVFSVMEPTYLQNLSLGLGDSFAGSIVSSMEVFRFISSLCLTLLVALAVIISMGISKLVYKVDCQELTNLLSESWSFDVHRILLAIRSLIFSFVALYAHFSCCCAYAMANSLACDAFLCYNTSSSSGVLNV
ncbi:unnamed protein product [Brassica oleracea var. botrytis]|uniref:Uncharacterized protein n=1 Tax=Brassica oleracea var. oleracea TaxID=109376 RepID=A0A0D3CAA4_BRAOL